MDNSSYLNSHKKLLQLMLCLLISLTQLGMSLYLPSFPAMEAALHVSKPMLGYTLTTYILGYSISMLAWGALAERYGAKLCAYLTVLIFSISSLFISFITQIDLFLIARLFEGFAGGGCAVLARVIAKDYFEGKELAKVMSYLSSAFIISLALGQLFSGTLLKVFSWENEFKALAVFSLLVIPLIKFSFMPTLVKNKSPLAAYSHFSIYLKIITRKSFILGVLAGGIGYSILASYSVITPFYFYSKFQVSPSEYATLSVYVVCSYLLGVLMLNRLLKRFALEKIAFSGFSGVLVSGFVLALLYFIGEASLVPIVVCVCMALLSQAFIYPCVLTMTLKKNGDYTTHATSLFGFIQQLMGAFATFFVSIGGHKSILPLIFTILLVGLIGIVVLMFFERVKATS